MYNVALQSKKNMTTDSMTQTSITSVAKFGFWVWVRVTHYFLPGCVRLFA